MAVNFDKQQGICHVLMTEHLFQLRSLFYITVFYLIMQTKFFRQKSMLPISFHTSHSKVGIVVFFEKSLHFDTLK